MFRWKLKMEYAVGCVFLDEMGRGRVNDALAHAKRAASQALETFYFFLQPRQLRHIRIDHIFHHGQEKERGCAAERPYHQR